MTRGGQSARDEVAGTRIHASCVLVGSRALLLRGASGSGKSTLVLDLLSRAGPTRLIRLIADDAVDLRAAGGRLLATAPAPVNGLIEVRGVGLLRVPSERRALVALLAELGAWHDIERLPEAEDCKTIVNGVTISRLRLPARDPANATRLLIAMDALATGTDLPAFQEAAPQ